MKSIEIINPEHCYSDPRDPYIFLPTSALSVVARLQAVGVKVGFCDENLGRPNFDADVIGYSLAGASYVPDVITKINDLRQVRDEVRFALGGVTIDGFTDDQFERLFGKDSFRHSLEVELGVLRNVQIPVRERVSLVSAYELISDEDMQKYLEREISLYLADGCRFDCNFCGANKDKPEKYRDMDLVLTDLEYLMIKAIDFGLDKLEIYLSNLDIFQTPKKLDEFASKVIELKKKYPGFELKFRGLATLSYSVSLFKGHPELVVKLREAGFYMVGLGVDGIEVWDRTNKRHNTLELAEEAFQGCVDSGFVPENLMVFAYAGIDTEETISKAFYYSLDWMQRYNAVPRPHMAKNLIPGNAYWIDPGNESVVRTLMENPELFQALDFTALATELTHPDPLIRNTANTYYMRMCDLPGATKWTTPVEQGMTDDQISRVYDLNRGKYDR